MFGVCSGLVCSGDDDDDAAAAGGFDIEVTPYILSSIRSFPAHCHHSPYVFAFTSLCVDLLIYLTTKLDVIAACF